MLETIKTLIKSKDICVLSTVSDGKPHCSLRSQPVLFHRVALIETLCKKPRRRAIAAMPVFALEKIVEFMHEKARPSALSRRVKVV